MHPSSSNQRHSEAATKGHAQRARGAMYAPVDPFKPSVALGVKKILGKTKDRTIDDIPVDRAAGGGKRKENGATRPSNEHPYSPNNTRYRPPPPPPLQNWYPNVPGSVPVPYFYEHGLPNPTWTSPYGQYALDNTGAPQASTGGWGQRSNNDGGDWAAGAGWGQGDVDPAWGGWNANADNGDWGLLGGGVGAGAGGGVGGEWGLPEGGIRSGATFGSGDRQDGEWNAGNTWGKGNIEVLDVDFGGESESNAGGGGGEGLYPPKEPPGQSKPAWWTTTPNKNSPRGERGKSGSFGTVVQRQGVTDEEDDDDGRGVANGSFFQQNNTVESAPESPQTVPSSSDDAAPMDALLEQYRSSFVIEHRPPRRVRYSSSMGHRYAPPPVIDAPPPVALALPGSSSAHTTLPSSMPKPPVHGQQGRSAPVVPPPAPVPALIEGLEVSDDEDEEMWVQVPTTNATGGAVDDLSMLEEETFDGEEKPVEDGDDDDFHKQLELELCLADGLEEDDDEDDDDMEPAEIPDPPSPAPQPSPIPPRSNALPGEASPFGLFGDFSLGSAEQTACTGTKRCSRCHTTSTPLWRFDRTTDEPLCEACYLTPGNEVKQPVSSTSSQATPTTKHCSRCNTTTTDIWRRDPTTLAPLCSACNMVESG